MTKYKVSFVNAKTKKREYLRDYKGNIRYYGKKKAMELSKLIGKNQKSRIEKVGN